MTEKTLTARRALMGSIGRSFFVVALVVGRGVWSEDVSQVSVAGADGEPLSSLGRLAQLERLYANGGADEDGRPAIFAGYDREGGFHLRDATGDYLLRLGVQLQIRHTYFGREVRGDSVDAGETGKSDDSAFELERARFVASGNVLTRDLTYKFQADGDTDGGGAWRTLDAYVEYWGGSSIFGGDPGMFGIGAGQFKPFFLRQEPTSAGSLLMVERNIATEFFNIDRNLGAWIRGDIGDVKGDAPTFFYALAVTNGFDSINGTPATVDNVPAFVGKLDLQLWGDKVAAGKYEEGNPKRKSLFVVGVSAATDQNNNSSGVGGPKVKIYSFGFDTAFKFDAFSFQGEYMGRWVDYETGNGAIPGGRGDSQYAHGFYGQVGILLTDSLELTGRGAFILGDNAQNGRGSEIGPGLNWYISGDHKIKLQTDVAWVDISSDIPDSTEDLDGTIGTSGAGSNLSSFSSNAAGFAAGDQGVLFRTQLQLSF